MRKVWSSCQVGSLVPSVSLVGGAGRDPQDGDGPRGLFSPWGSASWTFLSHSHTVWWNKKKWRNVQNISLGNCSLCHLLPNLAGLTSIIVTRSVFCWRMLMNGRNQNFTKPTPQNFVVDQNKPFWWAIWSLWEGSEGHIWWNWKTRPCTFSPTNDNVVPQFSREGMVLSNIARIENAAQCHSVLLQAWSFHLVSHHIFDIFTTRPMIRNYCDAQCQMTGRGRESDTVQTKRNIIIICQRPKLLLSVSGQIKNMFSFI